jgi:GxxExxY protein
MIDETHRDPRTYALIGAAMEVHRELGYGFLEEVYKRALEWEFINQKIPFQIEKNIPVRYKGHAIKADYRADFVCYEEIIVELKACDVLAKEHIAQTLNYLKATKCHLGLLINFGKSSLEFQRLVF